MSVTATELVGILLLVTAIGIAARAGFVWTGGRAEAEHRARRRLDAFRNRVGDLPARTRALRRSERARWKGWRDLVVTRIVEEGADVRSFHLKARDGRPLAPFEPGQFLTFRLHVVGAEKPLTRCYSLSGDPGELTEYRVSVKRLPGREGLPDGLGSSHFHGLSEGDLLQAKSPSGHFFLDRRSRRPVVLVGGGIGITPVLSMAKALVGRPDAPECWLFVGNRNRRAKLFEGELEALKGAGVKVVLCHSRPEADERPGLDHDHGERVSLDLLRRLLPDGQRRFHLCGPAAMMADLVAGLEAWGVADRDILYEAFGPATVKRAAAPSGATDGEGGEAGEVVFAKSGKTRPWTPAAGSLLDLAEAAGLALEAGCRAGNCGTCAIPLTEGEVSYLSTPGEPPEEGMCLPCVCVPRGRVVVQS